jgi:ribosomal protein S18 acetylase RimI-like enzyme
VFEVVRRRKQLEREQRTRWMTEIRQATSENECDAVRALVRAYIDWLKELYPTAQDSVDEYFQLVEAELASLPGKYGPPTGRLLLAYLDGVVAGTGALRDIGNHVCEMKRMFVYPMFHGKGIGRALATTLLGEARKYGYSHMRLETSLGQVAAQGLYRSLGFRHIAAYYELPEGLQANLVFMELRL